MNELLQKRLQREAAWIAFRRLSEDADDCCVLSNFVCLVATKMSMMMPSLSSMADEAARAEVQQLDVETVAIEDSRKLLCELHALPSELGCWSDRQLIDQPSDGNETND